MCFLHVEMALPTSSPTIIESRNQTDKVTSILSGSSSCVAVPMEVPPLTLCGGPLVREIVRVDAEGSNVLGVPF